ncbi:MAG: amino acid adenylation domain-containing protein, partial [Phaeodactylibacter sp.]|nr:amino acid adenylation domain-containing protein [Phaeodactylibacter sp.]
ANYWFKKTKNAAIRTQSAAQVRMIERSLNGAATHYLDGVTKRNELAEHTVLIGIFNALSSRYFEPDSYFYTAKTGSQPVGLLYGYQSPEGRALRDYLSLVRLECKEIYRYANYGEALQQGVDLAQFAQRAFFYKTEPIPSNTVFSFALQILRTNTGLQVRLHFQPTSDLDEALAEHFLTAYTTWVSNLERLIDTPIAQIPLLTAREKEQVLFGFNQTTIDFPGDRTLVQLFEAQAAETPDDLAVIFEDRTLTYEQLNSQANAFADYLIHTHGVEARQLIAVQLEKSELLPVILLGILKSGAAYVPVDQSYPAERVAYILEACACKLVVTAAVLDDFLARRAGHSTLNPRSVNQPEDLAYVMFTSGTTGRPKGVMVTHRNVIRLVRPCSYFPLNRGNVLLSTGSTSFDASTLEFFGTLLNGACLVLATTSDLLDLQRLEQLLARHQVDSLWMTAAWFNQVVEERVALFGPLRQLAVGGDVVSPKHVARLYAAHPSIQVINGYGPTECTTFATTYSIERRSYTAIPIGTPIPNTQIYLLDEQLNPVPIGVPGRLFIGGAGVATGYLNQPELTAEKFVPNPFAPDGRMYNSGDRAKWTSDGNILFLG